MPVLKKTFCTFDDLKEAQDKDPCHRYELIDGQIFMMGLTKADHGILSTTISRLLGNQLSGKPCQVITESLGVKVDSVENYYRPDVVVVCGKFSTDITITNTPSLIVEVSSGSTEEIDRNKKKQDYCKISSLKGYLIVSKEIEKIELVQMVQGIETSQVFLSGDKIEIDDFIELDVSEVYSDLRYLEEMDLEN